MIELQSIQPFRAPIQGSAQLPGSKSITNRALILAALAEGSTTLEGALFSRDTQIMLNALQELGFDFTADSENHTIRIAGSGGRIPKQTAKIDVGNAGTAARFLTAFLALEEKGSYTLDGDPAMRKRPMAGLLVALESLGAASFEFHEQPGFFPFTMHTQGFKGGCVSVDASASSQILSALLIAASAGPSSIQLIAPRVRPAYVAITLALRESFGATPTQADEVGAYFLAPEPYQAPSNNTFLIEPDISAASYFLALVALHGGTLHIPNLGLQSVQGDARFVETLQPHGLEVQKLASQWTVTKASSKPVHASERTLNFEHFSDTFLTYAALAPLLGKPVTITGIGHTRHQETDRIAGMAKELKKLGQGIEETNDSLTIIPDLEALRSRAQAARTQKSNLKIETYEDHRFAMSFAILGTYDLLEDGAPWLSIENPNCCGKTFPNFFETLNSLRDV